jgi:hypothetical protein
MSDRAILIGGVARSGTSLMRDIVGSHPDVAMFPSELPIGSLLSGALARGDAGRPDPGAGFCPGEREIGDRDGERDGDEQLPACPRFDHECLHTRQ